MDADSRRTFTALALAAVRAREQLGEVRREVILTGDPALPRLARGLESLLAELEALPHDLTVLDAMHLHRELADEDLLMATTGLTGDEIAVVFDRRGMCPISSDD